MKIKSVTLKNFKGAEVLSAAFADMNVITGRNANGKTSLLQGTKVGLIGYDPSLGKGKLAKLASGNMSVSLELSGEPSRNWSWKKTKTGLSASGQQPEPVEIASTLLDFRTFLDKSGPQQVAFVIEQTDLDALGFSRDALTAEIKSVLPKEPTEQTEAATKLIISDIEIADKQSADLKAATGKFNAAAWLELLWKKLSDRLKLAKQEVTRLAGSVQTGVKLASDNVTRPKAAIDRDIAATNEAIATLTAEKSVLQDQRSTFESSKRRREELQTIVNGAQGLAERLADLSKESNQLSAEVEGKNPQIQETSQALNIASTRHTTAKNKVSEMEDAVNRLTDEIEKLSTRSACPCCGGIGLACKANERTRVEKQTQLDQAQRDLLEAQTAEEIADRQHIAAAQTYNAAVTEENAIREKQTKINKLHQAISNLNQDISKSASASGELAGLTLNEPDDTEALQRINSSLEAQRNRLRELNQELTEATAEAAAVLRRNQETEKQAIAEAELEVTKLALDQVEKAKSNLVAVSMGNILKTAQLFAANIIKGNLAWENDELGIRRGGQWISHETFSGTEAAVAYIGVAVALCQSSKLKLVLMDELGVVDNENLQTLLTNIRNLINSGVVHQFIGCDVRSERYAGLNIEGLQLITV